MRTTTEAPVLEHVIGRSGRLSVRLGTSAAHLIAVDGETVRVFAPRDPFERSVDVVRTTGALSLRAGSGLILSGIRRRSEGSLDLLIEVPRHADVVVETGTGAVRVEGSAGDQRYRVTSGDLTLRDVSGAISIEAISGDVDLTGVDALALTGRTVSGDLRVRAATVTTLRLTTTSGDLKFAGQLRGPGPFAIKTVSGDSVLAIAGDAVVDVSSAVGRLRADIDRPTSKGPNGHRTISIGIGGPALTIQTLSGDVRLVPPVAVPAPSAFPEAIDDPHMDVLRALERGEIDPDEAERRLDAIDAIDASGAALPADGVR